MLLLSNTFIYYNHCIKTLMHESTQKKDTIDSSSNSFSSTQAVKSPKKKTFFRECVEFAVIAIVIVVPFRMFIAQPFIVNGLSMDPTFKNAEYLIVDQLTYHFSTPERGSVLIFKYPKDTSKYFIKRVIGLPGETVEIKGGRVTIKNTGNPEGFILDEPYIKFPKQDDYSVTLDNDNYYVLGDNRYGSADSRVWGPMPQEDIVGRPLFRLLPFTRIEFLPGDERVLFQ